MFCSWGWFRAVFAYARTENPSAKIREVNAGRWILRAIGRLPIALLNKPTAANAELKRLAFAFLRAHIVRHL